MKTIITQDGTFKEIAINTYVVTALDEHGNRVSLSQRMSKSRCNAFKAQMEAQMAIATPANKFFSDFRIEKREPEYSYKLLK